MNIELCEQCGKEWYPGIDGGSHHRCPEWSARLEAMSAQWAANHPDFVGPRPDNSTARIRRHILAMSIDRNCVAMMSGSAFLQGIQHAYAQVDGSYAWPNSREGDLLRSAKAEIDALAVKPGTEPVAWQARFTDPGQKWGDCSKEHHDFVKANPDVWPGYEVRELFAASTAD